MWTASHSIKNVCVLYLLYPLQRFKGTEPVEDVTEQIRTVKIEDKKELPAEVIDEVLVQGV